MAIHSGFIFDHAKYGWDIDGIVNLALNLINHEPFVALSPEPFTLQNWGTLPQHQIRICHSFFGGLLVTNWCVIKNGIRIQTDGTTVRYKETIESHNANKENIFEWLWARRDYLIVDQSTVGWDRDEKKFIKLWEYDIM